jgi:hypothetical protein
LQKIDLQVRPHLNGFNIQRMLETWAGPQGAETMPMGRQVRHYKTEGENMHWHIRGLQKGMGTVEVTYLPSSGKLTVLVHDNRRGSWAGQAYENLAHEIDEKAGQAE